MTSTATIRTSESCARNCTTVECAAGTLGPAAVPASPHFSDEGAGAEVHPDAGLLSTAQIVPQTTLSSGEIVILAIKPSVWFLVLVSVPWLLGAAGVILLAPWLESFSGSLMTQGALAVTAGRLIVALLQWSSRLYVLTNRRVMCYQGVVNVALFEAPLVQIRNTYLNSRPLEKLCKVGSIGFSLKGSKRVNAWWEQIANPVEVHERVRRAIEKALDHHSPL